MKKKFGLAAILCAASLLTLTACGGSTAKPSESAPEAAKETEAAPEETKEEAPAADTAEEVTEEAKADDVKSEGDADMDKKAAAMREAFGGLGMTFGNLAMFGEEDSANWERQKDADWAGGSVTRNIVPYNSVSQMVLALNSDKLDCAFIPELVASYLKKSNPDYVITSGFGSYDSFVMGVRAEDKQLCDDLNKAINELETDGTLAELQKEYLDTIPENTLEAPVEGRETLKVIVTGDYAPVDYINPEGIPQGYNVAIMQKIAEKLDVNIEFVTVEAPARLLALESGKGDIIFWIQAEHDGSAEIKTDEFGDKLFVTRPYLTCDAASITTSQEKTDIIEAAFARLPELLAE